ncbi:MAG: GNAT family N-acetyltransferase [Patescibacteria group bacterium]
MNKITLRKIRSGDIGYFRKWWRDKDLITLTSGDFKPIYDAEVEEYFHDMLGSKTDHHFMVDLNKQTIGHISLGKRKDDNYETQIVIGNKKYWGKGYGVKAIKLLLAKAKGLDIHRIYLEVRPENIRAVKAYGKVGFQPRGIKKYPKNPCQPETLQMVYSK